MSRKLWLLNALLLFLAIFAGIQLRARWHAEKVRERAEANRRVPPIPAPPFTAAPVPPAAAPVGYAGIAQKDLFDRSRNPDVAVEVIPPPPKPPMPPLPVYHGAMNFGDGPLAILSVKEGAPEQTTRPGEMIGPFKLIDITRAEITLEWDGQTIRKSVDELASHSTAPPVEATSVGSTSAPTPPPAPVVTQSEKGPGEAIVSGSKLCQQGDTTPFGTVKDGYRKTEISLPFGKTCLWDPVK